MKSRAKSIDLSPLILLLVKELQFVASYNSIVIQVYYFVLVLNDLVVFVSSTIKIKKMKYPNPIFLLIFNFFKLCEIFDAESSLVYPEYLDNDYLLSLK